MNNSFALITTPVVGGVVPLCRTTQCSYTCVKPNPGTTGAQTTLRVLQLVLGNAVTGAVGAAVPTGQVPTGPFCSSGESVFSPASRLSSINPQ